jgi:ADP-ribose pyrophosphatase YjhB (NUDIX family)
MTTPATNRPELAVSAAIFRDGKVLLARRAREPAFGLFTLPGGRVEFGETLEQAVLREVREETALTIALAGTAGYHEAIARGGEGGNQHHYVIVAFAARWLAGEPMLDAEHDTCCWVSPDKVSELPTTPGLAQIVKAAHARVEASASER